MPNEPSRSATAFDVVIPAHEKDAATLQLCVRGLLRHVEGIRCIHVVSTTQLVAVDQRVRWVSEPEADPFPDLGRVRDIVVQGGVRAERAGWLYQQILKLGAPEYIADLAPAYMVVDADVIWLRGLLNGITDTTRCPFTVAVQNHQPYRAAYKRLFGAEPTARFSVTAHNMTVDQELLAEMKREIEAAHGVPWWQAYLAVVDPLEISSISDYDTYGWWVLDRHPEFARHRQLLYTDPLAIPGRVARALYSREYDFVAVHAFRRTARWEAFARRLVQTSSYLLKDALPQRLIDEIKAIVSA